MQPPTFAAYYVDMEGSVDGCCQMKALCWCRPDNLLLTCINSHETVKLWENLVL